MSFFSYFHYPAELGVHSDEFDFDSVHFGGEQLPAFFKFSCSFSQKGIPMDFLKSDRSSLSFFSSSMLFARRLAKVWRANSTFLFLVGPVHVFVFPLHQVSHSFGALGAPGTGKNRQALDGFACIRFNPVGKTFFEIRVLSLLFKRRRQFRFGLRLVQERKHLGP